MGPGRKPKLLVSSCKGSYQVIYPSLCMTTCSISTELAGGWPPCIRVMVTESNCLSVGTLFIVTCTGATIGREKDMNHAIRIPDINVSKVSTSG